jgi:hypothetical protein
MALLQPHPPKEDDITSVLGRFKAWNAGLDARQEEQVEPFTGLQEISYEEALADLGPRRTLPRPLAAPQVDFATALNAARDTATFSAAAQRQASTSTPGQASEPVTHHEERSAPRPLTAAPAMSKTAMSSMTVPAAAPATERKVQKLAKDTRQTEARSTQPASSPGVILPARRKVAAQAPAANLKTATVRASKSSLSQKSASKATLALKGSRTPPVARQAAARVSSPTFKAVLEERMASDKKQARSRNTSRNSDYAATRTSMVAWVPARSVALKLRISPGEHAAIKAGASEAGLPLAAYMRQCTLDVEVLRKLLKQTIADVRTFEGIPHQPQLAAPRIDAIPATPSRPGLLKRLKTAWLDRGPDAAV